MSGGPGAEIKPEDLKEAVILTLKRGGKVHLLGNGSSVGTPGSGGTPPSGAAGSGAGGMVLEGATLTDEVRGLLAIWAFAILTILVVGVLVALAVGKISASDLTSLIQAIFAGTSGIIGAIIGFYFAGQQSKTTSPSTAPT